MLKAARVRSSFLSSGFELSGTAQASEQGVFDVGLADTKQIISNANIRSKNIMSQATNKAIGDIAGSFMQAGMGASMGGSSPTLYNTPFGSVGGGTGADFGGFTPTPVAKPVFQGV